MYARRLIYVALKMCVHASQPVFPRFECNRISFSVTSTLRAPLAAIPYRSADGDGDDDGRVACGIRALEQPAIRDDGSMPKRESARPCVCTCRIYGHIGLGAGTHFLHHLQALAPTLTQG